MKPLLVGWHWPLAIALALYLLSAVAVLLSRLRYDRRRRLLARVEAAVSPGNGAIEARPAGRASPFADVSSRAVQRFAFEAPVSRAVNEAVARFIVTAVGTERLVRLGAGEGRQRSRWKRVSALRVLALAAPRRALPVLERAMRDPDTEVVAAAVASLGTIADPDAGAALARGLERGYYSASRLATFLERFPNLAPESLRPLLYGSSPTLRYWGAVLCRRFPGVEWIQDEVARLSGDEAPTVRKAALQSLPTVGGPLAVETAARGLTDEVWFVRAHAARALGALNVSARAAAVAALLADREWWVRQAAKEALVRMGQAAEPAVVASLSSRDRFARNSAAEILQDSGSFERLLTEAVAGVSRPDLQAILRAACLAGGPRMVRAVVERLPLDLRANADVLVAALSEPEVV